MTREELPARVEHWRRILVPEWLIELSDKPIDDESADDYYAMCRTRDDYTIATLYFTDDCLARPFEDVEVTIVHELLHMLTRPWRHQIRDLCGPLGGDAYRALDRAREHEEEQLVDRLARVIVGGGALPGTVKA